MLRRFHHISEKILQFSLILIIVLTLGYPNLDLNVPTKNRSSATQSGDNTISTSNNSTGNEQDLKAKNGTEVNDPSLEIQLVVRGLKNPSNMAFLGPDDILVLEKNDGTVRRIVNGTMLPEPVLDVAVANLVERGMLGIAISRPNNASGGGGGDGGGAGSGPTYVFLYYTESSSDGSDAESGAAPLGNRLYRYEFVDGKLINPKLLLDFEASRGASHNGGKVLIGPDNNIYVIVGDIAGHKTITQNYHNNSQLTETSVIFRITQDGQPAGSILSRAEPANKFYAYGIRNGFGMDFDPITGKLWDTENGPAYGDEINLVEPGFNSGWGAVSGLSDLTGKIDPEQDLVTCLYCITSAGFIDDWVNEYLFGIQKGVYSEPEFTWMNVVGPTAIQFFNADKLGKQYENDIFVGDIIWGRIYHFELNQNRDGLALNGSLSDKVANSYEEVDPLIFAQGFRGITDIDVGPDGYLYFLTYYNDPAIYRIVPKGTQSP